MMLPRSVDANYFPPIQTKRVVVLIDGNGVIIHPSLIAKGNEGGRQAALRLITEIASYLKPQQFKLRVYVFLHKRGLLKALENHGYIQSAEKFDDFIKGLNEANDVVEYFAIIETGDPEEASYNKMRGMPWFQP